MCQSRNLTYSSLKFLDKNATLHAISWYKNESNRPKSKLEIFRKIFCRKLGLNSVDPIEQNRSLEKLASGIKVLHRVDSHIFLPLLQYSCS